MSQITTATNIENDDLTCPITLEPFRDPVLAKDGHVYEREAITRWIFEHGTSPFTREPLQINDLQPDDHLRRLAAQRRNSTVSFNARNNTVRLPPLRPALRNTARNNTVIVPPLRPASRNTARVGPERSFNPVVVNNQPKCHCRRVMCVMIILFVFAVIAISVSGIIIAGQISNSNSSSTFQFLNDDYFHMRMIFL
jgi:hypothetical protein